MTLAIHYHLTTSCLESCPMTFHSPLTIKSHARQLNIPTNREKGSWHVQEF